MYCSYTGLDMSTSSTVYSFQLLVPKTRRKTEKEKK